MPASSNLRVLVVDDSAYNRQTITAILESVPDVEVVGRATNGKEALKLAFDLAPDVVTLDLEMPEMDGFAFLRLLMNKQPTPVLVVSGYAQRENVFRALELGALDFVAKPNREVSPDLKSIEHDLVQKIHFVRKLQSVRLRKRADSLALIKGSIQEPQTTLEPKIRPIGVLAIGASTGGPPAIQQLLCGLPRDLPLAMLVAQHMPARFTRAFAERLHRLVGFRVEEAQDGQPLAEGTVHIAPGAANMGVREVNGRLVIVVEAPGPERSAVTITPSADHLFKSVARVCPRQLCTVVLTGMGSDGTEGARFAAERGARVIAEDPATAVMPGMPYSVIESGVTHEVVPLEDIAPAVVRFAEFCKSSR